MSKQAKRIKGRCLLIACWNTDWIRV